MKGSIVQNVFAQATKLTTSWNCWPFSTRILPWPPWAWPTLTTHGNRLWLAYLLIYPWFTEEGRGREKRREERKEFNHRPMKSIKSTTSSWAPAILVIRERRILSIDREIFPSSLESFVAKPWVITWKQILTHVIYGSLPLSLSSATLITAPSSWSCWNASSPYTQTPPNWVN